MRYEYSFVYATNMEKKNIIPPAVSYAALDRFQMTKNGEETGKRKGGGAINRQNIFKGDLNLIRGGIPPRYQLDHFGKH